MAIDNVLKAGQNIQLATPETFNTAATASSPQGLISSLSPAALYAQEFQPLYSAVNPAQSYPFTQVAPPFVNPAISVDPSTLTNSLSSASDGIGSILSSLGSQADSSLNDANTLIQNNPNGLSPEQYQQVMQDYQNYQLLEELQSTIMNIIANVKKQMIENMKLNG